MGAKKPKKRRKLSGIVYFAQNYIIPDIVKIGMTIETAESRLKSANKRNEFMPGSWKISQKVKTPKAKETEELAHKLFEDYRDTPSISEEMFYIPDGMTVKDMADLVREKNIINQKQISEEKKLKLKLEDAQTALEALKKKNKEALLGDTDNP